MGAIGIIRVSGLNAIEVANKMFHSDSVDSLQNAESRKLYYGQLRHYNSQNDREDNAIIDICLCTVSFAPNSYTGEDTVEFHCHGSPIILSQVMEVLLSHGVRQAKPGEFTKRAFLNGRMDLTQSEAVIDMIEAETPLAAQNAAGQLQGAVSTKLESIYNSLIDIMAHFHAVLDYPDEDIDDFKLQDYLSSLKTAESNLSRLTESYQRGRVLRNGIKTVIVGKPNTGKSSLLNALLGYNRTIVTEIPGTTRDTIEEKILVGNVLLRLVDTAGLRETDEPIEKLGVERSLSAIENAELVLLVLDGSEKLQDGELDVLKSVPEEASVIILINKTDLSQKILSSSLQGAVNDAKINPHILNISALTGEGINELELKVKELYPDPDVAQIGEIITNSRQYEAITRAKTAILDAISALTNAYTPDAILTEIETALSAVGEVTGKTMREDIISRIFERFCVGK